MPPTKSPRNPDEDRDLMSAIPGFDRFSSNLQQSVGPSCLLGLVITVLLIVILRRYVRLPLPAMVLLSFAVWWVVLVVLVRLGRVPDDDDGF
jgi:MFS superfamily sulfate permease-like transporter